MPNVLVQDTSLKGIADAIREKNKSSLTYKPADMAAAINSLPTGGGKFVLSGADGKSFWQNTSSAIFNKYAKFNLTNNLEIDPEIGIRDGAYMFKSYPEEEVPLTIYHATTGCNFNSMFLGCDKLKKAPLFRPAKSPDSNNTVINRQFFRMFLSCYLLTDIPEDWLDWDEWENYFKNNPNAEIEFRDMFTSCHSLKSIPKRLLHLGAYGDIFNIPFDDCYNIEKLEEVGYRVNTKNVVEAGSSTQYFLIDSYKLSKFTLNNSGPSALDKTVLDCSCCGYSTKSSMSGYEVYGFTPETEVTDDATYQALKNTDYWTKKPQYSRYNHNSMVETINSLPEIVKINSTHTNNIIFGNEQGHWTDEGGGYALTEEEIAVASAKGWTVTMETLH